TAPAGVGEHDHPVAVGVDREVGTGVAVPEVEVVGLLHLDALLAEPLVDGVEALGRHLDVGQGAHQVVLADATRLTCPLDQLVQPVTDQAVQSVERRWHVGHPPSPTRSSSQASNRSADSAAVWALRRSSMMRFSSARSASSRAVAGAGRAAGGPAAAAT